MKYDEKCVRDRRILYLKILLISGKITDSLTLIEIPNSSIFRKINFSKKIDGLDQSSLLKVYYVPKCDLVWHVLYFCVFFCDLMQNFVFNYGFLSRASIKRHLVQFPYRFFRKFQKSLKITRSNLYYAQDLNIFKIISLLTSESLMTFQHSQIS